MTAGPDRPQDPYQRRCALAASILVLLAAMAYVVVRYHVLKGVSWHELPLWGVNKALSLSALVLAALAALAGLARERAAALSATLWQAVMWTVVLHVLISTVLLGPDRYPGFYTAITTTSTALQGLCALSLLLGGIGIASLLMWRGQRLAPGRSLLVLGCAGIHVALLGFTGWFNRFTWPGGLPPVSLIAAGACAVGMGALLAAWVRGPR